MNPEDNEEKDPDAQEENEPELEVSGSEEAIADALAAIESGRKVPASAAKAETAIPAQISGQSLRALSSLMAKKDERLKEVHDRLLRLAADFDNYKKRIERDRERWSISTVEGVLLPLLPIVDSFERTLQHAEETHDASPMLEGIRLVHRQVQDYLSKQGVRPIKALGEPFNPQFHDAIAKEPNDTVPENQIIKELERGYLYHDRLLRPSKVVVAGPAIRS